MRASHRLNPRRSKILATLSCWNQARFWRDRARGSFWRMRPRPKMRLILSVGSFSGIGALRPGGGPAGPAALIGPDNILAQGMPHHVPFGEMDKGDPVPVFPQMPGPPHT